MLVHEGDERLSETDKAKGSHGKSDSGGPVPRKRRDKSGTLGRALRTVYDETLREDVPKDFLDLLGKLD